MIIKFTPDDVTEALVAANAFQDFNEARGYKDRGAEKDLTKIEQRDRQIVGHVGHLLIARRYHLPYAPKLGDFAQIDIEFPGGDGGMEVRASIRDNPRLPINPRDIERGKLALPFVLIRVSLARGIAEILGWLCGWQALERPDRIWRGPPQNTWYVPAPYHSVQSLDDWIESGAKPHWMPKDFDPNRIGERPLPFADGAPE